VCLFHTTAADCGTDDQDSVSVALSSYTAAYKEVSDRLLAQNTETLQSKRLRAGAASLRAGLDAYKTLFAYEAGASTAECEQYRELLRQQALQQARSAIQAPTAAQGIGATIRQGQSLIESHTSESSGGRDRDGSSTKSGELSELPEGFRCAASCTHASLPMPLSVYPRPQCDRDERRSGRVHDLCALAVWLRYGKKWDEPTNVGSCAAEAGY
jgi:hypothetical protein